MLKKVPGKGRPGEADRRVELMDMFPDDATAEAWFESAVWPKGRHCPHCGNAESDEEPQADALLVRRLPVLFLRAHRDLIADNRLFSGSGA